MGRASFLKNLNVIKIFCLAVFKIFTPGKTFTDLSDGGVLRCSQAEAHICLYLV